MQVATGQWLKHVSPVSVGGGSSRRSSVRLCWHVGHRCERALDFERVFRRIVSLNTRRPSILPALFMQAFVQIDRCSTYFAKVAVPSR
jgi:hypothetical protein